MLEQEEGGGKYTCYTRVWQTNETTKSQKAIYVLLKLHNLHINFNSASRVPEGANFLWTQKKRERTDRGLLSKTKKISFM